MPGIVGPLTMLCNRSFVQGEFPLAWKLSNVTPLFKKGDRQDRTNYRPVSLLPSLFKALDSGKEVRMIFLDISKAFDRVWHKGLLFFSGSVVTFMIGISE